MQLGWIQNFAPQKKDDVVGLLNLIRHLCYGTDVKRYTNWIQQAQLRRTIRFEQQPGESLQKFAANFLEQVRVFLEESFGPFVPTIARPDHDGGADQRNW